MTTTQPRKAHFALHNLPVHQRKKSLTAHLSGDLRKQYGTRTLPVRKGDTVKVMRGEQKGKTGKVSGIDAGRITIDGVTRSKTDGTKAFVPIHASNLMLTDLDQSDAKRKTILDRKGKKAAAKEKPAATESKGGKK